MDCGMRAAWIALLLLISYVAWTDSNPPAPTKSEKRTKQENQAAKNACVGKKDCAYSGPISSPVTVNVSPSPTTLMFAPPCAQGNGQTTNAEKNDPSPEKGWSIHDPNAVIAFFTVVLAGVGFAQVRVGCLQWRTYKAQTSIFTAQNRAFVFLEKFELDVMLVDDGKEREWRVIAIIKNSGTTPARNLFAYIQRTALTETEIPSFGFPPNYAQSNRLFIGPQAKIELDGPRFDIRDINNRFSPENKKFLFVWGWMEYDDIFPSTERHRTEFCMELNPEVNVDLNNNTHQELPRFVMHSRHNGSDGECMHIPRPQRYDHKRNPA